jgi:PAS domain S-box-containing protein
VLAASEQVSCRYEKRYIHKNGSFFWADVSFSINADANSLPRYFIVSVIDISERKKLRSHAKHWVKGDAHAQLQHRVKKQPCLRQ